MRVLIVDDHEPFRGIVRRLLVLGGFEVAGEIADGESAVEAVRSLGPEVVLVDVQLPGIDGFEVARRLAAERGAPSVVLISSRPRSSYGDRLDDASVRGFIAKHEFSVAALRGVLLAGSDAGDRRG